MESKYIIIELLFDFLSVNEFVKLSEAIKLPNYLFSLFLNKKFKLDSYHMISFFNSLIEKESLYISDYKRSILKKTLKDFNCDSIEKVFVFIFVKHDYSRFYDHFIFLAQDNKLYEHKNGKLNEITFLDVMEIITSPIHKRIYIDHNEGKLNRYELNFIGFFKYYKIYEDEDSFDVNLKDEEKFYKIIIDPEELSEITESNEVCHPELIDFGRYDSYDCDEGLSIIKWKEYYGFKKICDENKTIKVKLRKSIEELLNELTDEEIISLISNQIKRKYTYFLLD